MVQPVNAPGSSVAAANERGKAKIPAPTIDPTMNATGE